MRTAHKVVVVVVVVVFVVVLSGQIEDSNVGGLEPVWVQSCGAWFRSTDLLFMSPTHQTTAPLRSCRLQHITFGSVASQIKAKSPRDTRQSTQRFNAARAKMNALPGRLELPGLRLAASCSNQLIKGSTCLRHWHYFRLLLSAPSVNNLSYETR